MEFDCISSSKCVIFIVASHIYWGHLIKEKNCSHWSKVFPLRVDPIFFFFFFFFFEDVVLQVSKQEVTKIVSL